jgi:hypothetical protein
MKTFKFFQKEDYFIPRARRGSGRTIAQDLVPVQPLGPRTRECAVISSSVRDFNNWRNETFDRSHAFIVTNRDFLHTNGVSGIPTRYRAITRIYDCYGLTFDDYITTDRIEDILLSGYEDGIDHIRQLIVEVNLHTRDNESI